MRANIDSICTFKGCPCSLSQSHHLTFNPSLFFEAFYIMKYSVGREPPLSRWHTWHIEPCRRSVARSILAHRTCHILSHGITLCHYLQAVFQMTGLIAVLDNISDSLLGNIEHQTHILLAWQYICCYGDFLPPWRSGVVPFSTRPLSFFSPCSQSFH